jgi:hypothetical protein
MSIYHCDWIKIITRLALRISSMRGLNKVLAGTFIPFTVISLEKITYNILPYVVYYLRAADKASCTGSFKRISSDF